MIVDLPIKTGRGMNDRVHWAVRANATKKARADVCSVIRSKLWGVEFLGPVHYATRIRVTLTRISPGTLDSDNLQGALKACRDGVADAFKHDDAHPYYVWQYAQEKCKRGYFGVRIQIEPEA